MNVIDVRARVAQIGDLTHDPEAAHAHEDELHIEVLTEIADGAPNAADLAAAALETRDLDFPRR